MFSSATREESKTINPVRGPFQQKWAKTRVFVVPIQEQNLSSLRHNAGPNCSQRQYSCPEFDYLSFFLAHQLSPALIRATVRHFKFSNLELNPHPGIVFNPLIYHKPYPEMFQCLRNKLDPNVLTIFVHLFFCSLLRPISSLFVFQVLMERMLWLGKSEDDKSKRQTNTLQNISILGVPCSTKEKKTTQPFYSDALGQIFMAFIRISDACKYDTLISYTCHYKLFQAIKSLWAVSYYQFPSLQFKRVHLPA